MMNPTAFIFVKIPLIGRGYTGKMVLTGQCAFRTAVQPATKNQTKNDDGRGRDVLLVIPVLSFGLGCWQWKRHQWKTNLLAQIHARMAQPPEDFPSPAESIADVEEYRRVRCRGQFLYDRQFLIRWRSRLDSAAKDVPASKNGAQVITPFRVEGTDLVIMVNRGWLPLDKAQQEMDSSSFAPRHPQQSAAVAQRRDALNNGTSEQQNNIVEFGAVVRKSEKPNWFLRNYPNRGIWVYKNLDQMAALCGAAPILVDADDESTVPGGPIGGQTNANLRNAHFEYMTQWFGISAITAALWTAKFLM